MEAIEEDELPGQPFPFQIDPERASRFQRLWPWNDYSHLAWGSKRTSPRVRTGEKSRVELLLLDFLAFRFVHPAQALLNSTPQLLARDRRAVAQAAQPWPRRLRMDAAAQAAVGAGDDVFLADDFSDPLPVPRRVSRWFLLDHGLTSVFETATHKPLFGFVENPSCVLTRGWDYVSI